MGLKFRGLNRQPSLTFDEGLSQNMNVETLVGDIDGPHGGKDVSGLG